MSAPQYILIGICVVELGLTAMLDGRPRVGKYSFSVKVFETGVLVALLYWGGFFA
jgi:hypothetical protein